MQLHFIWKNKWGALVFYKTETEIGSLEIGVPTNITGQLTVNNKLTVI